MKKRQIRTFLSITWLIFTLSLVCWWFIFVLENFGQDAGENLSRQHRMLFYEGFTLVLTVVIGGIVMTWLSYRDDQRHQKVKLFFANFSHDIKTSITRLRLQADILREKFEGDQSLKNNKGFQRLLRDINQLDLQLENSLFFSHADETKFYIEQLDLAHFLQDLQKEFDDIKIQWNQNAIIAVDHRAFRSILRNFIDNARKHGQAQAIEFFVTSSKKQNFIDIFIKDDGQGFKSEVHQKLGQTISPSKPEKGSGLGLHLSQFLMEKMKGQVSYKIENSRIQIQIHAQGEMMPVDQKNSRHPKKDLNQLGRNES